ncbi:DUF6285 domain-containing protein [Pseudomonas monteilii]|uniref:DUF6285 domain-containing protein n=1 Tax=Pseudomonas monteilii TaxID=76759 RepID=UPI003D024C92
MSFSPDAENLLLTARLSLLNDVLPQLPESLRYQVRMIANAMVIASRELKQGDNANAREAQIVEGLLTQSTAKNLVSAIRSGEFDQPGQLQESLLAGLSEIIRNDLLINKPKAVQK